MSRTGSMLVWIAAAIVFLASAHAVQACSVCFGDPNSDQARGAVKGILFLGAVITSLLASIAGIAAMWFFKARQLRATAQETQEVSE